MLLKFVMRLALLESFNPTRSAATCRTVCLLDGTSHIRAAKATRSRDSIVCCSTTKDFAEYDIKLIIARRLTKILHFVKLRTFAHSPEDLLLHRSQNPLKRKVEVPDNIDDSYTDAFLAKFKEPLNADS